MKRIEGIKDLEPFGIIPLTGESDAHMYRILCDVTLHGKRIVERTLAVELKLADEWNSGSRDSPHVGSFLLPFEFIPPIAVFCLLMDADICEVWLMKSGAAFGFGVEDVDLKERLRRHHEGELRKVLFPRPSDRNVHQFTGRSA